MRRQNGFTLTELLVSIAIIVLIAAIVVPTAARARRQARSIGCQGRLRQWGFLLDMFTSETDGVGGGSWSWWWGVRRYSQDEELLLCPMATKSAGLLLHEDEDTRWDPFGAWEYRVTLEETVVGSFGKNGGVYPEVATSHSWTSANIKAADNIPVMLDGLFSGAGAYNTNTPPAYEEQPRRSIEQLIRSSCINRHNGSVNCVFMDSSVRKVGLKGLWRLKWDRRFDTCGYLEYWEKQGSPTDWPDWMQKFPDY